MNSFATQQSTANIGRIMTGKIPWKFSQKIQWTTLSFSGSGYERFSDWYKCTCIAINIEFLSIVNKCNRCYQQQYTNNKHAHQVRIFFFSTMDWSIFCSIINRDGQTTNVGTAQTIMLTNSPNSIILTGQQQQQPTSSVPSINRNLIDQESMIYTSTSTANPGRNELFYEPTNAKQARLWQ